MIYNNIMDVYVVYGTYDLDLEAISKQHKQDLKDGVLTLSSNGEFYNSVDVSRYDNLDWSDPDLIYTFIDTSLSANE